MQTETCSQTGREKRIDLRSKLRYIKKPKRDIIPTRYTSSGKKIIPQTKFPDQGI